MEEKLPRDWVEALGSRLDAVDLQAVEREVDRPPSRAEAGGRGRPEGGRPDFG